MGNELLLVGSDSIRLYQAVQYPNIIAHNFNVRHYYDFVTARNSTSFVDSKFTSWTDGCRAMPGFCC